MVDYIINMFLYSILLGIHIYSPIYENIDSHGTCSMISTSITGKNTGKLKQVHIWNKSGSDSHLLVNAYQKF